MYIEAPLSLHTGIIPTEWIDYNGHMNVAYYVLAFDHATDEFLDYLGLDSAYRERSQCSTFALEAHVTYQRELVEGDPIRCTTQVLDFDSKRVHYFHHMYHAEKGFLAATNELISMHIDMAQRRSAPMPGTVLDRLETIAVAHRQLPHPPQTGNVIGIRSKSAQP